MPLDLKIEMKKVVVRATHCPHYLTASYVKQYGKATCAGCFHKPHEPNRQLRPGPPRQR